MEEQKSTSVNVTNDENFGLTKADLRVYESNLTPVDWDNYPKITISMGEDLEKYQKGMIRIDIMQDNDKEIQSYWIQVDGLMTIVYSMYAKTLNDLRRATIRQKTVRVWGILRKIWEKFKK
jgi:hypothetical protein